MKANGLRVRMRATASSWMFQRWGLKDLRHRRDTHEVSQARFIKLNMYSAQHKPEFQYAKWWKFMDFQASMMELYDVPEFAAVAGTAQREHGYPARLARHAHRPAQGGEKHAAEAALAGPPEAGRLPVCRELVDMC